MPCSLKPQSKSVAFGSSGLLAVSRIWFNRNVFGLSVSNWPKLFFGPAGFPVMPPSICADRWMPLIHNPGGGASAAGAASVAAGAAGAGVCADALTPDVATAAAARSHTPCLSLF